MIAVPHPAGDAARRRLRASRSAFGCSSPRPPCSSIAVGLAAFAVSAAGPIEFVAFVVPQIALRIAGGSRPPVLASAIYGAILVVAADLVARVILPVELPVGIVTSAIGAPYLIWLLVKRNRKVTA